jgi:hypothetical protein
MSLASIVVALNTCFCVTSGDRRQCIDSTVPHNVSYSCGVRVVVLFVLWVCGGLIFNDVPVHHVRRVQPKLLGQWLHDDARVLLGPGSVQPALPVADSVWSLAKLGSNFGIKLYKSQIEEVPSHPSGRPAIPRPDVSRDEQPGQFKGDESQLTEQISRPPPSLLVSLPI